MTHSREITDLEAVFSPYHRSLFSPLSNRLTLTGKNFLSAERKFFAVRVTCVGRRNSSNTNYSRTSMAQTPLGPSKVV